MKSGSAPIFKKRKKRKTVERGFQKKKEKKKDSGTWLSKRKKRKTVERGFQKRKKKDSGTWLSKKEKKKERQCSFALLPQPPAQLHTLRARDAAPGRPASWV